MKPPKPKPLKPITRWALLTHRGTLALGDRSQILTYRKRKEAAYEVSKADGERVVKIEIREKPQTLTAERGWAVKRWDGRLVQRWYGTRRGARGACLSSAGDRVTRVLVTEVKHGR